MEAGGGDQVMTKQISLLDAMLIQLRCEYLSDLHNLDNEQRVLLAQKVEQLSPEDVDLRDWNDALEYMAHAPPERTAKTAKERLIHFLSQRH